MLHCQWNVDLVQVDMYRLRCGTLLHSPPYQPLDQVGISLITQRAFLKPIRQAVEKSRDYGPGCRNCFVRAERIAEHRAQKRVLISAAFEDDVLLLGGIKIGETL